MVRNTLKTNIKQKNKRKKKNSKSSICLDSNFTLLLLLSPIEKILKVNMPRHTEALTHNFEYNDHRVSMSTFNILHNEVVIFPLFSIFFLMTVLSFYIQKIIKFYFKTQCVINNNMAI